jgi:FkbM family methyltransferase
MRMKLRRQFVTPSGVPLSSRLILIGTALLALAVCRAYLGLKAVSNHAQDVQAHGNELVQRRGPSSNLPPAAKRRDSLRALCANPQRLGDAYGGWTICVPAGYSLNGSLVYSVGIGRNIAWDEAMIAKYGTVHHGFDPTPTAIDFFRKRPPPSGFVFHKYGLGVVDGKVNVKLPVGNNDSYTSLKYGALAKPGTVTAIDVLKLDSMLAMLGHKEIEILKADIEGAEFDVISDWASRKYRPPVRQVLIEFHDRYFRDGPAKLRQAVREMEGIGFVLLHKQKNWVRQGK